MHLIKDENGNLVHIPMYMVMGNMHILMVTVEVQITVDPARVVTARKKPLHC